MKRLGRRGSFQFLRGARFLDYRRANLGLSTLDWDWGSGRLARLAEYRRNPMVQPHEPARWDALRERYGIESDDQALAILARGGRPGDRRYGVIVAFAKEHYQDRFIPEMILDRLGLDGEKGWFAQLPERPNVEELEAIA